MGDVYFDGVSHEVFDCLGDVLVCTKGCDGRYIAVNKAFVERSSARSAAEIVGKTAWDFFPAQLARVYEEQDQRVIKTRTPLRDELELISRPDGTTGWYLANKFPLFDRDGTLAGVVGTSQDLNTPCGGELELFNLRSTIEFIHDHLEQPLKTEELAKRVELSITQLDRRMKRVFRLSTKKYVMKCRLELATKLLTETNRSLADISAACGFSDQSAFSRHFRSAAKVTPGAYRKTRQH